MHHTTLQRLAFVKYLYTTAVEQSKSPELLAAAALLTFHDVIELFLQIASEHLDIESKQPNFMDYWHLLSPKLENKLPQKESMKRLNKARALLKHQGTLPSKLDVESFRASTTSFLEDASMLIFTIPFSSISLIEYVNPEPARIRLKQAEELAQNNNYQEAINNIGIAYKTMIGDYENRKIPFYNSSFSFGGDVTMYSSSFMGLDHRDHLGQFVDTTRDSITSMQQAIKVLALGLDYRKYSKFKCYMPSIQKTDGGQYVIYSMGGQPPIDKNAIDFCINYVIESSIKLNEFDDSITPEQDSKEPL